MSEKFIQLKNTNGEFIFPRTHVDIVEGIENKIIAIGSGSFLSLNGGVVSGTISAKCFNVNSDARLKEHIELYKNTSTILDLPVYTFDYIDGPKNQLGCLAQDLQKICPELVEENKDGYLSIKESKLVYLLLEEVKSLKKEIEELKKGK